MPRRILLEQFQIAATVAGTMPDEQRETIREILVQPAFWLALQQAIRIAQAQFPELQAVKFTLSV